MASTDFHSERTRDHGKSLRHTKDDSNGRVFERLPLDWIRRGWKEGNAGGIRTTGGVQHKETDGGGESCAWIQRFAS